MNKALLLLISTSLSFRLILANVTPFLVPGFSFSYDIPGQSPPLPISAQCETLHLTWSRGSSLGPPPTAPYFLQVYSSSSSTAYLVPAGYGPAFDWQVPFPPGTQYQICMIDTFGVSGGCQSLRTMVPDYPTVANSTCQNVTAPAALSVVSSTSSGPIPQYGSINQCSDVVFTPQSGKPPFTLTIAPSLHPPLNFTSNSMDPIPWTVSLPEGFPFFASMSSSDGLMWANGPMHVGGSGSLDCLSSVAVSKRTVSAIAIGSSLGSAVVGIVLGIAICWSIHKRQLRKTSGTLKFNPVVEEETRVASFMPGQDQVQALRPLRAQSSAPSSPRVSFGPGEDQAQARRPSHVQSSMTASSREMHEPTIDPLLGAGGRPPRPLPSAPKNSFPPETHRTRNVSMSSQGSLPSSSTSALLTHSSTYGGPQYLDHLPIPENDLPPEYIRVADESSSSTSPTKERVVLSWTAS